MTDGDRLQRFLRTKARDAGRQYEQARKSFTQARREALQDSGERRFRIVCRRYAEKREVSLDVAGCPSCFDSSHPDCQGCVEDIESGRIETWE